MRDQKKAEAIAAQRMQLLSPLLAEGLDPAKASQLKAQICDQTGLSERTVRRYLNQYRAEGFSGLKPKGKGRPQAEEAIPTHVLEQAILLRREVPRRSVAQIIQILEWEGLVQPGELKRSTLRTSCPSGATVQGTCSCMPHPGWPPVAFSRGIGTDFGIPTSSMGRTYLSDRTGKKSRSTWLPFWMTQHALFCMQSSIQHLTRSS